MTVNLSGNKPIVLGECAKKIFTDHHNAYNTIREGEEVVIAEYKQMSVVSQLKIETGGAVVLEPNAQLIII